MTVDQRQWAREAIRIIEADFQRSADTHLIPWRLPACLASNCTSRTSPATPPAASSIAWRARCSSMRCATAGSGRRAGVEASSGSTAISEAYFARLLGLPFIAVMPASTSKEKIAQIAFYGGQSHLVEDPPRSTPSPNAWRGRAVAISWTSSPMPSAPPTGGRTTTSPNRSSSRCATSRTRPRPG